MLKPRFMSLGDMQTISFNLSRLQAEHFPVTYNLRSNNTFCDFEGSSEVTVPISTEPFIPTDAVTANFNLNAIAAGTCDLTATATLHNGVELSELVDVRVVAGEEPVQLIYPPIGATIPYPSDGLVHLDWISPNSQTSIADSIIFDGQTSANSPGAAFPVTAGNNYTWSVYDGVTAYSGAFTVMPNVAVDFSVMDGVSSPLVEPVNISINHSSFFLIL